MDPIARVQALGERTIVLERVADPVLAAAAPDHELVDEIGPARRAPPEKARRRRRPVEQQAPLLLEHVTVVLSKPIHVIEKHEGGDAAPVPAQKIDERARSNLDAIDEAIPQLLEVF